MKRITTKPASNSAKKSVARSPRLASMKRRIGSPKYHSRAATMKNRSPRETSDTSKQCHHVELHDARSDGDNLVGQRSEPASADDPDAPLAVKVLEILELVHIAVDFEHRAADGLERRDSNHIAERAANDRCDRTHSCDPPGPGGCRQHHRNQHHVGRNRKKRALGERDQREQPHGAWTRCEVHGPVVKAGDQSLNRRCAYSKCPRLYQVASSTATA